MSKYVPSEVEDPSAAELAEVEASPVDIGEVVEVEEDDAPPIELSPEPPPPDRPVSALG